MSIPRLAIHRPVTMFMLSGIIVLLGAISLTRLPVDLMPEFEQPTISVNVNYAGVGPLEMEELITRPMEQAVSAVAGLEQVNSSSQEGRSNVRLNFGWGTDMTEAVDDVRTRIDRVRGRLPENADPPTIFKADSNAMPIIQLGGRRRLRPGDAARDRTERPVTAPRARARRCRGDRQRRPAPPDSRRALAGKDHGAQPLGGPRGAARCARRTRTCRSARSTRATRPTSCAARGSSRAWTTSATWS